MKKTLLLAMAVLFAACSRNPDPEYAPEGDGAAAPSASASVETQAAPPATPTTRLSDDETMRLGREAAALLFAQDIPALWPRFDGAVQTQAGSAENFGAMVTQIFGQLGEEMNVVEEMIETNEQHPALSVYRRRGHYLAISQDANLIIVFNPDGTIAGLNFQPAE